MCLDTYTITEFWNAECLPKLFVCTLMSKCNVDYNSVNHHTKNDGRHFGKENQPEVGNSGWLALRLFKMFQDVLGLINHIHEWKITGQNKFDRRASVHSSQLRKFIDGSSVDHQNETLLYRSMTRV